MPKVSYTKYFDIDQVLEEIKKYLPKINGDRFLEAFHFAEKAHNGQVRKDGVTPYIYHPVEIVKILIELHADEETLISALLHDVPEDTKHDIHEIKDLFGEKIAFLVDGITKLSKVHYQHNMPERQVESLKKLFLHSAEDLRVIIIKLADRLHNMSTLENIEEPEKQLRIAGETLEIYVPIANLLGIQDLKSKLEDLCFKYIFPTEYVAMKKSLGVDRERRKRLAHEFIDSINKAAAETKIDCDVFARNKNLYSIYKKISSLGKSIESIDNRVAIRIIVNDLGDCYRLLGLVHGNFVPMTGKVKDYISNPKSNGYQSLHTTVFGPEGIVTEVQIRTKKMHIDAEYGVAASFFEKDQNIDKQKRSLWVKTILDIEKTENDNEDFMENLKHDVLQDRIFVFTPRGAPVDLPKGASILDFAYAIHTELGNHVLNADVNGRLKSISTVLSTGDVVNIVTSRKVVPELSWLSFIKTNVAKNKILSYLKKVSKEKRIIEGHKILQKEFDISGLGICENLHFKKLRENLLKNLNQKVESLDDLFMKIGGGEIRARDVIKAIEKNYKHLLSFKKDGVASSLEHSLRVNLKIISKNRFGLMRDISEILYKHALDMYSLKGWASRVQEDAYFTADFLVDDVARVGKIFDELEQVDGVKYVYRVSNKGLYLLWFWMTVSVGLWIFHPFFLRLLGKSQFSESHPVLFDFFIAVGLLSLLTSVMYLTKTVKKYFPIVRKKSFLWVFAFCIPLIALVILILELAYFGLKMSWPVLASELVIIYAYLTISYRNYKKSKQKT